MLPCVPWGEVIMGEFGKYFGYAFSALFPVINPIGSALVFLGLVGDASHEVFRTLARKIAISTVFFLLAMELAGTAFLRLFGISLPVVQLAGGLVLAAMGWSLLNEEDTAGSRKPDSLKGTSPDLQGKVFYPFTFPITAGPGALVVMLTLSAHASKGNLAEAVFAHLGVICGMVLMCVAVFVCYAYAPKITQKIPPTTAHGVLRVIAFILLSIGVQIAWNGFHALDMTRGLPAK